MPEAADIVPRPRERTLDVGGGRGPIMSSRGSESSSTLAVLLSVAFGFFLSRSFSMSSSVIEGDLRWRWDRLCFLSGSSASRRDDVPPECRSDDW